jgi:3'-phosphoadenosine 5'-phosphosulfate sulfotransferase (PAPS reductase)/FAD synthetase
MSTIMIVILICIVVYLDFIYNFRLMLDWIRDVGRRYNSQPSPRIEVICYSLQRVLEAESYNYGSKCLYTP